MGLAIPFSLTDSGKRWGYEKRALVEVDDVILVSQLDKGPFPSTFGYIIFSPELFHPRKCTTGSMYTV